MIREKRGEEVTCPGTLKPRHAAAAEYDGVGPTGRRQRYRRAIVKSCPHHVDCSTSRTLSAKHARVHGNLEPFYFLVAWVRAGATRTADNHRRFKPSPAAVAAVARELV
eukprot:2540120-Pyramimonas_sp.AAC.1